MKEELSITHSIMTFGNLASLLATLDESSEVYSKLVKRFEERLGILLRNAKESGDKRLQALSGEFGSGEDPSRRKDDAKKREPDEKGWAVLQSGDYTVRVATGSEAQTTASEISILFKIIESLRSKILALEETRKLLTELPSQGFRSDIRLRVVFKDGVPKYVFPTSEVQQQVARFQYGDQFQILVLK